MDTAVKALKLKGYILVIATTILSYDFVCTFPQEVSYVWSQPCSIGTILFFLNRYLPFIDITLSLRLLTTINTPEQCYQRFMTITWFITVGMIISQLILLIRTYAMWHLKRSITILLVVVGFFAIVTAIIFTHIELSSLKFGPVRGHQIGCNIIQGKNVALIAYVAIFVSETTIVILTMIKASRHLRHSSSSSWVFQLYRDGLIFYLYLLAMTIANMLVPVLAPPAYKGILANPQRVLHSVLCTRVILLILRQRNISTRPNTTNSYAMSSSEHRAPTQILSTIVDTHIGSENEDNVVDSRRSIRRDWTL